MAWYLPLSYNRNYPEEPYHETPETAERHLI